jgi:hypothetical protein
MTVCAKETFTYDAPGGAQVVIHRGRPLPDDHPAIKGREHLFESTDAVAGRSSGAGAAAAVETATAAPGERRSAVVPRKGSGSSRFAEEGVSS